MARPRRKATPARLAHGPFVQEYLFFVLDRRRIAFPLVHVRLRGRRGSLRTVALADSGATATFVPVELAREVGLPLSRGLPAGGGGGKFPTFEGRLSIEVLHGGKVIHRFTRLPVSVPRGGGGIPYVVLGRDSLFRAFRLTFDEHRQRLVLVRARSPRGG
jgi:hypothetical protein